MWSHSNHTYKKKTHRAHRPTRFKSMQYMVFISFFQAHHTNLQGIAQSIV